MLLVIAATPRELAGAAGARTLVCGIGPHEAYTATEDAVAEGGADIVLHVGIAGARVFTEPAVVIGSEAVYCDADDPRFFELRLAADPQLLARVRRALPDARVEPIGTSGRVGGSSGCEIEAMEGYAVLRAAALAGVPAVEVRVLANAIGEPDRSLWRFDDARAELRRIVPLILREFVRA